MGDLRDLAEWLSTPPLGEEKARLQKIAVSMDEVTSVLQQVGNKFSIPIALGLSALAGIGQYKKTKAEFDPRVEAMRDRYYGAN